MAELDDETLDEARRLYQRGRFYLDCGLPEDAVDSLRRATEMVPGSALGWSALSEAHQRLGDAAAAEAAERRAAALNSGAAQSAPAAESVPDRPKGRVFSVTGRGDVVERPAPAGDSGDPEPTADPPMDPVASQVAAYNTAADAGDWPAAEAAARAIIEARPEDAKAWGFLGLALRYQFRMDEAVGAHRRAVEMAPETSAYLGALAKSNWEAGDYDRAVEIYVKALNLLQPDGPVHADTRLAAAMIKMLKGDLATGLEEYESRWQTGKISLPPVDQPMWDGQPAPDQRILFYGEQGFGDAIQFARFIPMIAARAAKVVVPCKPAVKRLIASVGGGPDIRDEQIGRNDFDLYIPAMSSMRAFGMDMASIPADVPYLAADQTDIDRFRAIIGGDDQIKVGIAWTGSPTNTIAWKKTVDPALFAPLLDRTDTVLYSLQIPRDDMAENLKRVPLGVVDLAPEIGDFADTAAAIECLDLVVTVDTAVAHLAGALGKPVWTLTPFVPDWRWFLGRTDSPWYPSMRLFRQIAPGDWRNVIAEVVTALEDFSPTRRRPPPPSSQEADTAVDIGEDATKPKPKKGFFDRFFGR